MNKGKTIWRKFIYSIFGLLFCFIFTSCKRNPNLSKRAYDAVIYDDVNVLEKLLRGGMSPDHKDSQFGVPLLTWSVVSASTNTFLLLLETGADVNNGILEGKDALINCCENSDFALFASKKLIEHGACVNEYVVGGNSPVRVACREGNMNVVNLLIANGADISSVSSNGVNALMYAAYSQNYELVESICNQHKHMISKVDNMGLSAAFWAIKGYSTLDGSFENLARILFLLEKNGCYLDQVNKKEQSIMDYAVSLKGEDFANKISTLMMTDRNR